MSRAALAQASPPFQTSRTRTNPDGSVPPGAGFSRHSDSRRSAGKVPESHIVRPSKAKTEIRFSDPMSGKERRRPPAIARTLSLERCDRYRAALGTTPEPALR